MNNRNTLPAIPEGTIPDGGDVATWGREAGDPLPDEEALMNAPETAPVPLQTDETPKQAETLSDLLRSIETAPYIPPQSHQEDVVGQMRRMRESYISEIQILKDAKKQIEVNIDAKQALLQGCENFLAGFEPKAVKKPPRKTTLKRPRKKPSAAAASSDHAEAAAESSASSPADPVVPPSAPPTDPPASS